ncbi:MAG: hypothetical protein Q9163_001568 [Psora crenata]
MENLSLQDLPPGGGSNHVQPPPPGGPPQLPPQMFTTAAHLLDLTDTNLVLTEALERIFVQDVYADIPRGVFLVRGENVLLLGEIDLDKDDYIPEPYRQVSEVRAYELQKAENEGRQMLDKKKAKRLHELGFEVEHAGEALF